MSIDFSESVFLKHYLHDCVIRTTWEPEIQKFSVFVRYSGQKEYSIEPETKLFTDAELQPQPIREEEYYNF